LSLVFRPGNGAVAGRKVAVFVGPQVAWNACCAALRDRLVENGAVVRCVASHIGPLRSADGETIDADASFANEPGFLFDALVLPDGCESAADDARALESVRDVYRHCKPIFAFGSGADLLARAGVPGDAADAGLIVVTSEPAGSIDRFIAALGAPRDFSRETDPPRV
jgi:catalase